MAEPIEKSQRVVDPDAIDAARVDRCEICNRGGIALHVHHVRTRGAGGGDVEQNLICLCAMCHDLAHRLRITAEEIDQVIASRSRFERDERGWCLCRQCGDRTPLTWMREARQHYCRWCMWEIDSDHRR